MHIRDWETLMVMKLLERLIKELQMTNQTEFRVKKVIKKTACKLYIKWRGYDICLIAGQIKTYYYIK